MKTENMTFSEALEAMKQGYKVKRASWTAGYIYLKNKDIVYDDCDNKFDGVSIDYIFATDCDNKFDGVSIDYIFATDWEIYNEPKPEPKLGNWL
jgi:hypothetical protein